MSKRQIFWGPTLSATHAFTLVIPTFNRSAQLGRLLAYLKRYDFRHQIFILDASEPVIFAANATSVAAAKLDIRHLQYPPTIQPTLKVVDGLRQVQTPYCSFCADDDLIFVESVEKCIALLNVNAALVAAHGLYLNFSDENEQYRILNTFYDGPTIVHENALTRLAAHMRNYEAMFYALYRTPVLLSSITGAAEMRAFLFHELLQSALVVAAGGVARINDFFYARSTGPSHVRSNWHPIEMVAKDASSLFQHYVPYRDAIVNSLMSQPGIHAVYASERLQEIIDVIHLRYVSPILSLPTLDTIIDEHIAGKSGADISARIEASWKVPPPALRQLPLSARSRTFEALGRADYVLEDGNSGMGGHQLVFNYGFLSQALAGGRRIGREDVESIARHFGAYAAA